MEESETEPMNSLEHVQNLLKQLNDFRASGTFCDYTIVAGSERIAVHKNIMASCSDYFRALTTSDWRENSENVIHLDALDGPSVKAIVDFAYSGEMKLNMDNIYYVVPTADYLQVQSLLNLAEEYLYCTMTVDTCVDVYQCAKCLNLDKTCIKSWFFMTENISKISKKQYTSLTAEQLKGLLGDDKLKVKCELFLVSIVKDWMEVNRSVDFDVLNDIDAESETWMTFADLLSQIRWPLLGNVDWREDIDATITSVMNQIKQCCSLFNEADEYHSQVDKQPVLQTARTTVRCNGPSLISYERRGDQRIKGQQRKKSGRKYKVINLQTTDVDLSKNFGITKNSSSDCYGKNAVTYKNFLFVCDGLEHEFDCRRYDPRFDSWFTMAPLQEQRSYLVLLAHSDKLYAIGGSNRSKVNCTSGTSECYDMHTDTWSFIPALPKASTSHAGCVYNDSIFVSGGGSNTGDNHADVFRYDIMTKEWIKCADLLVGRESHIMVNIDQYIYVLGGSSWNPRPDIPRPYPMPTEQYSTESDQWTICEGREKPTAHIVIGDKLYLQCWKNAGYQNAVCTIKAFNKHMKEVENEILSPLSLSYDFVKGRLANYVTLLNFPYKLKR